MSKLTDLIQPDNVRHLAGLFSERVKRSENKVAYQYFNHHTQQWLNTTWLEVKHKVARIQQALRQQNLSQGQCVAIMAPNCPEWMMFEQAALGLGLVVVPLYTNDRADNINHIINDSGVKILLVAGAEQCRVLETIKEDIKPVKLIVSLDPQNNKHEKLINFDKWLEQNNNQPEYRIEDINPNQLASIVYTSGTTGRPKGVMLSHNNILQNAYAACQCIGFYPTDIFLSFLPLSHMFERTVGYYLPMLAGSKVVYARSIEKLADDLIDIKPTILVTVPRIFERVYNKIQLQLQSKPKISQFLFNITVDIGWHWFRYSQNKLGWHPKLLLRPLLYKIVASKVLKKLGGELRLAISGGAALSPEIAHTFIGLGLNISQGYGMTEASPVVCTNLLHDNEPDSVGQKFFNIDVTLGQDNELLVKGPTVMLGYLNNQEATDKVIDKNGWLHTGDKAKIINEHIYITGRIKDIMVLSTGEKIPPNDIEMAITTDPLFEQAIVYGEGKPFLSVITVLNLSLWQQLKTQLSPDKGIESNGEQAQQYFLDRIKKCLRSFPGYARIYKIHTTDEAWTIDNGLATPTLKLKRKQIINKYQAQIDEMYKGH
ncbi:long-chain fatty acid--CoA ligase [Beggiatoa alba]|nr:long-chain fatty acid--CoA ligase [Beggiatoa alba]